MENYGTIRWSKNVSLQLDEIWEIIEKLQSTVATLVGGNVVDYSAQIADLQQKVAQIQLSASSVKEIADQNSASIETLQTNLQELSAAVLLLQQSLETDEADLETLQTNLSNVTERLTALEASYTSLKEEVKSVSTNVFSLNKKSIVLQDGITELNTTTASLQDSIASINTTTDSLQASVNSLSSLSTDMQSDISDLDDRITVLDGSYATLNNSTQSIQTSITSLTNEDANLQSQISSVETSVNTVSSQCQTLSTSLLETNSTLSGVQQQVLTNQSTISTTSQNVAALQTSDTAQNGSISLLQADVTELQENVETILNTVTSGGQTVDLSLFKTNESDICENEIQNVSNHNHVSSLCEIEARLTADTTYRLDSFKCLMLIPTKISFLLCARPYETGVYGNATLNFYFDNTLIHSIDVACTEDKEYIYEFSYNFIPTGQRQYIFMEMVHLSKFNNTNVRICVQYVKTTLHAQNCWFYEAENAPIAFDIDAPASGNYLGQYPVFTFGNVSRYLKFYEFDAETKQERDWNVGPNGTMQNVLVPNSKMVWKKKFAIYHFYSAARHQVEKAVCFTFLGQGPNCMNKFIPNMLRPNACVILTLHTSVGLTILNCPLLCPLEINNHELLEESTLLTSTYSEHEKMYGGGYLAKDQDNNIWKVMLTYYQDNHHTKKVAPFLVPEGVGEVADVCSCVNIFDSTFPYFGMVLFVNTQDEIYLCGLNLDKTKMGEQFEEGVLYVPEDDCFPLFVAKGINPFGRYKNGKLYIYYSYINRIYCKIFDLTTKQIGNAKFICLGQFYSEGDAAYHIRNEGVMSHVCKCDLPQ